MTSLDSAIAEFYRANEADNLSLKTQQWYKYILGAFASTQEGAVLAEVTASMIRAYIVKLRATYTSSNTVSGHIRGLHRFWGWASKEYKCANPMENIKYPGKATPEPKAATEDDIKRMYAAAGEGAMGARNRAILLLLLDTGCRAAGLCKLTMDDLEMDEGRALVTEKGSKTRWVIFTQRTASALRAWFRYRQPIKWVFYDIETLKPLKPNGLYQLLRRIAKRGGVEGKFNPHSFRHLFAKHYVQSGGDLATLSRLLGHRDVSTTVSHYTIFTREELRQKHEQHSPVTMLPEIDDETKKSG
jgi:integrase/recombinase XerD